MIRSGPYKTRLYFSNQKQKRQEQGHKSIEIGDQTEKYVANLMSDFKDIKDVEIVGNLGGMFDITYKCRDEDITRAVQVKTLSPKKGDSWSVSIPTNYFPDTLMIFVNVERTRFGLIFYKDIDVKFLTFGFKNKNTGKYRRNKFNNEEVFKNALHRRLHLSSHFDIATSTSENVLKEFYSLQRLENKCKENEIQFARNITNGNTIDCFLNTIGVQCKFRSTSTSSISCTFNISKSKGLGNSQPYHINDPIDYFVFEIGGTPTDREKYHGYFCIIPKNVLNEEGYLENEFEDGKKSITLCFPEDKNHWTSPYWNNYHTLKV